MIKVTGAHGQRGTAARPGSLSMASTMAVTPVLVSTIIGVVGDLALRSVWIYPGSMVLTLIGPLAYSARSDSPSEESPALLR
ncbi:Uncharacterised protein [Mycobacteroides abscessus subsp. massiliense]|nr:Uncharacterised protein [Mycobacteroides abscessus subsp. massiliense]